MVQIVENWADIRGEVESLEGGRLRVRVLAAEPVEGFPNLLADTPGASMTLEGDREGLPVALRLGSRIRCRVRKAAINRYIWLAGSLIVEASG